MRVLIRASGNGSRRVWSILPPRMVGSSGFQYSAGSTTTTGLRLELDEPCSHHRGYTRLVGALKNLGYTVGRNTVKRILSEHGIDPAPERGKRTHWKTFIKAHLGEIAEADFFTVEVLTLVGLLRYYVFFVIDIETRRVHIAGISDQPHGRWMQQIARNLTDAEEGFLRCMRYLLVDRDPLYTDAFRGMLREAGVDVKRMPPKSPNLRPHAERFVRSIKEECLSRMILLGERHLRRAVTEYSRHYHTERNHQGLGNELVTRSGTRVTATGPVNCHERLGGLLRYYYREAGRGLRQRTL